MNDKYPHTKDIIYLLGVGTLVTASILMPGLALAAGSIAKFKNKSDWEKSRKEWKKFNPYILRRNIKRLREQKVVEIIEKDGQEIIKLTQKGHTRYLKFKLEQLSLKERTWDGKWRIVIYDIPKFKKNQQSAFRYVLKYINFFKLQNSVYLTPYPCDEQISYLREYFMVGEEVLLFRVDKIENEQVYREYFGLA